jgi:uncharacterized alkaline shock family protein YloU
VNDMPTLVEDGAPVPPRRTDPLTVSRRVIVEMVRLAALEVPGVLKVRRGGPLHRLAGSPVRVHVRNGEVSVRIWLIARPGHELRQVSAQVRQAIATTVQRLLGLEPGEVTVVVDGVGSYGQ